MKKVKTRIEQEDSTFKKIGEDVFNLAKKQKELVSSVVSGNTSGIYKGDVNTLPIGTYNIYISALATNRPTTEINANGSLVSILEPGRTIGIQIYYAGAGTKDCIYKRVWRGGKYEAWVEVWNKDNKTNLQKVSEAGSVTDKVITTPGVEKVNEKSGLGYRLNEGAFYLSNYDLPYMLNCYMAKANLILLRGRAPEDPNMEKVSIDVNSIKFSKADKTTLRLSYRDLLIGDDTIKDGQYINITNTEVRGSDGIKNSFNQWLNPDTGWIDVTFQNGTTNYGGEYSPVQYRKIGNRVFVQGMIKGGTTQANNGNYVLFNLPLNFRPKNRHIFSVSTNNTLGRIDALPNGNINGVVYRAEWASLEFSFLID